MAVKPENHRQAGADDIPCRRCRHSRLKSHQEYYPHGNFRWITARWCGGIRVVDAWTCDNAEAAKPLQGADDGR